MTTQRFCILERRNVGMPGAYAMHRAIGGGATSSPRDAETYATREIAEAQLAAWRAQWPGVYREAWHVDVAPPDAPDEAGMAAIVASREEFARRKAPIADRLRAQMPDASEQHIQIAASFAAAGLLRS